MRIDIGLSQMLGAEDLIRQAAQGVRVLAGELPELPAEQLVPARILQASSTQTLVQVKGSQVVLEALPGFSAGEEVQVRLATTSPEPLLQVTPRPHSSADLTGLRIGQEVAVTVLEELPGGRVLLGIRGTEVEAAAPETLPRAERFTAVVEQTGPELVLQILDSPQEPEAQATQLLREHLPAKQPLGQVMQDLQEALSGATSEYQAPAATRLQAALRDLVGPERPPTPERVARILRDGGLQYEAKLAQSVPNGKAAFVAIATTDLKGLILQTLKEVEARPVTGTSEEEPRNIASLAQGLEAPQESPKSEAVPAPLPHDASSLLSPQAAPAQVSAPTVPGLAQSLMVQLNQIETQQAINLLAQAQGGPFHFQIPLGDGPQLTTVALAVERDPRNPGDPTDGSTRGHNLYFHLDLDQLGPVKIDAHIRPHALRAIFYTERPETQRIMQAELSAFSESLQTGGYAEVLLAVRPDKQMNLAKRKKFAGLAHGLPERLNLFDVRA